MECLRPERVGIAKVTLDVRAVGESRSEVCRRILEARLGNETERRGRLLTEWQPKEEE